MRRRVLWVAFRFIQNTYITIMKDKTKPYIDQALEALHSAYPEIKEVHLEDDLEIGVDFEDGEMVHIFYSIFYERGQKFGGPKTIRDEHAFVQSLIISTLHHHLKQVDDIYKTLDKAAADAYVMDIVNKIYMGHSLGNEG